MKLAITNTFGDPALASKAWTCRGKPGGKKRKTQNDYVLADLDREFKAMPLHLAYKWRRRRGGSVGDHCPVVAEVSLEEGEEPPNKSIKYQSTGWTPDSPEEAEQFRILAVQAMKDLKFTVDKASETVKEMMNRVEGTAAALTKWKDSNLPTVELKEAKQNLLTATEENRLERKRHVRCWQSMPPCARRG